MPSCSKTGDLVSYVCIRNKHTLSYQKIKTIAYLVDFESTRQTGKQITTVDWRSQEDDPLLDTVLGGSRFKFSLERSPNDDFLLTSCVATTGYSFDLGLEESEIDIVKKVLRDWEKIAILSGNKKLPGLFPPLENKIRDFYL